MIKWSVKTLPALFVLLALFLGAWTAAPGVNGFGRKQSTAMPDGTGTGTVSPAANGTAVPGESATPAPSGTVVASPSASATAETATAVPGTAVPSPTATAVARGSQKALIAYLNSFSLDISGISAANVSGLDKAFLNSALAMNTAELQMLRVGAKHASNSEIRSLTRMMIQMHEKDQALLTKLQGQVGGDASPSLRKVAFLPGTAEYSLGFRTVDLKAMFLDKVNRASDGDFDQVYLNQLIDSHALVVDSALAYQADSSGSAVTGGPDGSAAAGLVTDGSGMIVGSDGAASDGAANDGGGASTGAPSTGPVDVSGPANPTLRMLATHAAQEASLHKMLAAALRDRIFYHQRTIIIFPAVPVTGPSATPSVSPTAESTSTATTATPAPTGTGTETTGTPGAETTSTPGTETTGTPGTETTVTPGAGTTGTPGTEMTGTPAPTSSGASTGTTTP